MALLSPAANSRLGSFQPLFLAAACAAICISGIIGCGGSASKSASSSGGDSGGEIVLGHYRLDDRFRSNVRPLDR